MYREVSAATGIKREALAYMEVTKPLPSLLLAFLGIAAAIIAGSTFTTSLWLIFITVLFAAAGANGLTNYLDRDIDARMERTCRRALPSGRVYPPQRVLPLIACLIFIGLILSLRLGWPVFLADVVGTLVAATWRKKVTCVYPQGVVASCTPVLMGWLAVRSAVSLEVLLLCLMIAAWLPLHVWSLIIAHRGDYIQAGLDYFPVSFPVKGSVRMLLVFSLALYAASIAMYFTGGFGWLYLATANVLGIWMVYGSIRLVISGAAEDAWKLYKLSTFPYLGLIFLVMCLDVWLA
ncbi:MAG: protoheme IX farnesyltransferase [Dehalococcoidales bacterium]|nr:protoheme IX farnesyltransferase [Dehalococcoidales bacterium]